MITNKGMSDDAHTGQLPRALTGVRCRAHSPQYTGQLPRALTRALTAGEGSAGLEEGACLTFLLPTVQVTDAEGVW
jgi:hypothetical protein